MVHIAHIINPVDGIINSDLHIAQPITFESMRQAKLFSRASVEVELLSTYFEEDATASPPDFRTIKHLQSSILDYGNFKKRRRLPILREILERAYYSSHAEYIVYTNVDIVVQPYFYNVVADLVTQASDAFIINRRTISDRYTNPSQLALMCSQVGEKHPGYDCFVFPRTMFTDFVLENVCIGAAGVGLALMLNLYRLSQSFRIFEDSHLTFHIGNEQSWKKSNHSEFRDYNFKELNQVIFELERLHGKFDETMPGWGFNYIRENCRKSIS